MSLQEAISTLTLMDVTAGEAAQKELDTIIEESEGWEGSYDTKCEEHDVLVEEHEELKDKMDDIKILAEEALK
jgi:hypothetical protein